MFLLQVPIHGNQGRGLCPVEDEGNSLAVKEVDYVLYDLQSGNSPTVNNEFQFHLRMAKISLKIITLMFLRFWRELYG